MVNYGYVKEIELNFEEALNRVKKLIKEEGFGILTEIDVKEKFKEKLGLDFKKYVILGACNPQNAYKAISSEENIGLLLPCNVIVYEKNGKSVVAAINPVVAMSVVGNDNLRPIAEEIGIKLKNIVEKV